ncbi:MAG TPA: DMT family transporter [Allosphingosinicella sp.]|jgi:drug/metabolite transporter (DMT)-like permease|nr:DMT family transporter [Allosphingosinicella sp.]
MASARPHPNRLLGILLRIGAASCFGCMGGAIKLGYDAGVSTPELVFYRFGFGLPPLLLWIAASRNVDVWRTRRPMAHVWRACLGLTTMAMTFSALFYLPLAEATTIAFAAPLFSVILSALVLKEPVGRHRWSAVAIGFAGVMVVMRPHGEVLPPIGLAIAVAGALGVGAVTITLRQIGKTEGTQTIVLWFTCLSLLGSGLLMPFYAHSHDERTWIILFAIGSFGGLGQLLMTAPLRYAEVPVIVPFDYVQLLWAVLLGWLLFADRPPASTWAGAAIIVASGLYTVYREHRLGRDRMRAAPL